ncbi:MAG: hypothetical protein K8J08_16450 [Thermoanaerobaculia bacterium]|nr:hypothetical protein [Thermoanaerobaculia bacterium]
MPRKILLVIVLASIPWVALAATTKEEAPEDSPAVPSGPTCQGLTALDDSTVESGYGFVPSATTGTYVQEFESKDLGGGYLTSVCLCFLKTRPDYDIDFEVVVYGDSNGVPAAEPIAAVAASQRGVARSKKTAGAFVQVPMPNVPLPPGKVYIGARWNPSEESFLFICNDQSPAEPKVPVFFIEDRAKAWTSVFSAKDPIFRPHRAIMVRAGAEAEPAPVKPVSIVGTASAAPVP